MKNMSGSKLWLSMTATILAAALVATAAAQSQVPFKGTLQGNDSDSRGPVPGTPVVTTTGAGIGTLLGQFSFTQQGMIDLAALTETGTRHWIAANGDSIDTTITGSAEPTDTPNVIRITEVDVITAGTGRFAGAQGSFIVERLGNGATFMTSGSYHG